MDELTWKAAIEAQFVMGHCVAGVHMAPDGTTIAEWSWNVDDVRQRLHVPANALWDERVLELEAQGLATFCLFLTWDAEGNAHEIPGGEDAPREDWGEVCLYSRGVLRMAALYGRPYVRCEESPALLAHWRLVQGEFDTSLRTPHDRAQLDRQWPEQAIICKAREAESRPKLEEERP